MRCACRVGCAGAGAIGNKGLRESLPGPCTVALDVALAVPLTPLSGPKEGKGPKPEPATPAIALLIAVAELLPDALAVAFDVACPPLPPWPLPALAPSLPYALLTALALPAAAIAVAVDVALPPLPAELPNPLSNLPAAPPVAVLVAVVSAMAPIAVALDVALPPLPAEPGASVLSPPAPPYAVLVALT